MPPKALINVAHFHITVEKRIQRDGHVRRVYGEPTVCEKQGCTDLFTMGDSPELLEMVMYRSMGADACIREVERLWRTYTLDMIDYVTKREYDRGYKDGYEDGVDD